MTRKKIILVLFAITMILVAAFTGCSSNTGTQQNSQTAGQSSNREQAYDFSWKDTNGNTVRLSELKGKVVLLDFWATWCGPCKMTIPYVEQLYEDYENKGVEVIGVNLDQGVEESTIIEFVKEKGMKYLVIRDASGNVSSKYGVTSIPRFFFIDKQGRIANVVIGYKDDMYQAFSEELDKLLEE